MLISTKPSVRTNESNIPTPEWAEGYFQIERVLASGAHAEVKLATDRRTSEKYVLKYFNIPSHQDCERVKRMAARVMKMQLKCMAICPWVVKCYGKFEVADAVVLVCEYMPKGDLLHYLQRERVSPDQKKQWLVELAVTIARLHQKGIVFRDLSLLNVLLGDDGHIRLCDFGLASELRQGETITEAGGARGYKAPEIVDGKPHGMPADWWALGIICYYFLTGRLPFLGGDCEVQITTHPVPILPSMPDDAQELLLALLEKNPDARISGLQVLAHMYFKEIDWGRVRDNWRESRIVGRLKLKRLSKWNAARCHVPRCLPPPEQ